MEKPCEILIVPYRDADFDAVTQVWFDSACSTGLAMPVTLADLRARWPREMAGGWAVVVAKAAGVTVGFMALQGSRIDQLFVAPDRQGRGIGKQLVDLAKAAFPDGVCVTGAVPGRATRFYEREGFARGENSWDLYGQAVAHHDWRPAARQAAASPSARMRSPSQGRKGSARPALEP